MQGALRQTCESIMQPETRHEPRFDPRRDPPGSPRNAPRDVVLDAGEAFTLDRPGTAIVYALADARVVVQRPAAASVRRSDTEPARRSLRELAAAPRSAA